MSKSDRGSSRKPSAPAGPSQRQLRAGELVRHSLAAILIEEEIQDPDLKGVSVTVTEVRMSSDLKHATCFTEPLGAGLGPDERAAAARTVAALNRNARFLRGRLGRLVELKFTPELRFVHDQSFGAAAAMDALFTRPEVARDLDASGADAIEET
jgi:ribosome-binding factor A